MSAVAALKSNIAQLGWRNALTYRVARALETLSRGRVRIFKYYFVAQPVPLRIRPPAATAGSLRIFEARPGDDVMRQFPRPAHVIRQRFDGGAHCFVAERNGALVGYIWLQPRGYVEDEVRCRYTFRPAHAAAWDFDVYVAPEHRMSRAFARLWEAAHRFGRERGYDWTISRISAFNPDSLRSHRRLGIVHLDWGLFVRFGRAQLSMLSRAPFVHLSLQESSVPTLTFDVPGTGPDAVPEAPAVSPPLP